MSATGSATGSAKTNGVDRRGFLRTTGAAMLGVTAAGAAGAAGCEEDSGGGSGPIRIGALYPISGPLALLGEESWRGASLALRRRNDEGGVAGRELEFVRADVPDVNAATSEARRLTTQEELDLLIGTYSSSLALAASEVAARSEQTFIELGAITDEFTERDFDTIWRVNPPAATFTQAQMEFVRDWVAPTLEADPAELSLAVVHEDSSYGSSVARTAEQQANNIGVTTINTIPYNAESSDLSSVILNLRSMGPDVVVAVSYAEDAVLLGRQSMEYQLQLPAFIGTGGGHSLASFVEGIGEASQGVLNVDFTQFEVDPLFAPGVEEFIEAYRDTFDSEPQSGHSLANFMGANLVFDLLEETEGSLAADEVGQAARDTDVPEGETATGWGVQFDENNQNTRARPYVTQWIDEQLVTVWPEEAAVTEPQLITPFQT